MNRDKSRRRGWIVVALLAAALSAGTTTADAAVTYPIETAYTQPGPYGTTTGTVTDSSGAVIYDLFYPSDYQALGFASPIITWGNGSNATPDMYSTLLTHFASYGFTVIASTQTNTGSGTAIDAAAHYLVSQNTSAGSVFYGRLEVNRVAAVGHSQGAGGATRAATNDPGLIKTLVTFSLPNTSWVAANPDCPAKADCMYYPAQLTQPTFLISTHGPADSVIASPSTELAFYNSIPGDAAVGIITNSDGEAADHSSIQNTADGGNPGGELGYATAWLQSQLRGDASASGTSSELVSNSNWPGSAAK
jgi:pimeloyl-ACP methyl ester carboxylesterase